MLSNVIGDWSITGIVRDGVGNPVAGASVDADDGRIAYTLTDAAGRFVLTPKREHPAVLHINAWKEGYGSQHMTVPCVPSCAITADFRLRRIVRQWLDGPSTMQVGDVAPVAVETIGDLYEAGRDIGGRAVIGRDHLRVLLFWAAMLGGLYILQTLFS